MTHLLPEGTDVVLLKGLGRRSVWTHKNERAAQRRVDALIELHGPKTKVERDDDGVFFVDASHFYRRRIDNPRNDISADWDYQRSLIREIYRRDSNRSIASQVKNHIEEVLADHDADMEQLFVY